VEFWLEVAGRAGTISVDSTTPPLGEASWKTNLGHAPSEYERLDSLACKNDMAAFVISGVL
jgi:hypothetical protein